MQPDCTIERHKARLVARSFSQTRGIDYFETFSHVVRYESVRAILALATKHDMELVQFDVKTAFLNSSLDEDVYMQEPEGYEDGLDHVCHLRKGLYGLKHLETEILGSTTLLLPVIFGNQRLIRVSL